MSAEALNRLPVQACIYCNRKKTKCRLPPGGGPCQSCSALQIQCVPRARKKRESLAARSQISAGTSSEKVHFDDPQSMAGDLSANESQSSPVHQNQIYLHNSHHVGNEISNTSNLEAPSGTDWATNFQDSRVSAQQTLGSGAGAHPQHQTLGNRNGAETANPMINDNLASKERDASQALTYIGRSHYIAGDSPIDEVSARSYTSSRIEGLSSTEAQILELSGSFSLPPKSARQSLIETFMQYCYPWMPTLILSELDQDAAQPCSLLLMQSVFLAASRVSSSPVLLGHASSEQFYQRAKALFWAGHEKDPLNTIKAITMLHWYNPDGPAFVSCDTSEFWLKIGVGLAYQIGLHKEPPLDSDRGIRRRIWWSLVVRDALISVSRGRPRAVNMEDAEIGPPCLNDFPNAQAHGELFIPYVEICCLLGDLVECIARKRLDQTKRQQVESVLFRWTRTLPLNLRLSQKSSYDTMYEFLPLEFKVRQLHIPYFICLTILARSATPLGTVSPIAVLAASFVAGIYENFLARDQVKYLQPVFTSFGLVSGIVLLSLRPYHDLWEAAKVDFDIILKCLLELSKRWKSAIGASKALQKAVDCQHSDTGNDSTRPLIWLTQDQSYLFEGFSLELCRMWAPYEAYATQNSTDSMDQGNYELQGHFEDVFPISSARAPGFSNIIGFNGNEGDNYFLTPQYGGIGNWFMSDWAMNGTS